MKLAPFNYQRQAIHSEVKAVNDKDREILHAISSDSVDRAGDIVEPGGAKLDSFLRNPVVLVNHDYRVESIIGKAVDVRVTKDSISARTRFLDTPLARDAFELAKAGIGGWSIGFRPLPGGHEEIESEKGRKGFRFTEWELLEYSAVAIPMNQDIVNNSVVRSLDPATLSRFFVGADPPPLCEPLSAVEATPDPVLSIVDGYVRRMRQRLDNHQAAMAIREDLHRRDP